MTISESIYRLLVNHDKVVVPNLGIFYTHLVSSHFDPVKYQITPPVKNINFSEDITEDDELLTNFIAQNRQISFDNAKQLITNFVQKCQQALENDEAVDLAPLGQLSKNKNEFQFIGNSLDNYGLEPVKVQLMKGKKVPGVKKKKGLGCWLWLLFFILLMAILVGVCYFFLPDIYDAYICENWNKMIAFVEEKIASFR